MVLSTHENKLPIENVNRSQNIPVFLSLHQPVAKKQLTNNKYQPKLFQLLQFGKRNGHAASSFFSN